MSDTPPSPPPDARAAQRMAMLQELGEMGMELARALKAQALAALEPEADDSAPKVTSGDPVLMFTRVARAIRQTVALEMRLAHPDRDPEAERWRAEAAHGRRRRKDEVRGVAQDIIEIDGPAANRERLFNALDARLDAEGEDEEDFTYLPMGVLLARVCRELGVRPNWSLWADEPWAIAEARAQVPGSPFTGPDAPDAPDDEPFGPRPPPDGETPAFLSLPLEPPPPFVPPS